MGVHTDLTPAICEAFCELIRVGNYFVTACGKLGISEQLAYQWEQKGKAGEDAEGPWPEAYRVFVESLIRADAEAEAQALAELRDAGRPHDFTYTEKGTPFAVTHDEQGNMKLPGDWRSSAEFLARRFSKRWSPTQKQEIGGTLDVNVNAREDLVGRLSGIAARHGAPGDTDQPE